MVDEGGEVRAEVSGDVDAEEPFTLDQVDMGAVLEAILMVASNPVSSAHLAAATGTSVDQVERALAALVRDYDGADGSRPRGFELRFVDGGWRIYSRAKWAPWVGKFVAGADTASLTQAALETLAIVAYKQPVTRNQIAQIRGVNVDAVLRTLLARDLVAEAGQTPTGAHLFSTTTQFLERMGISDISELPPLAPFMPGPESDLDFAFEQQGDLND